MNDIKALLGTQECHTMHQSVAVVNEATAGALVKLLVAAAEREDELFAKLSSALASNDPATALAVARSLVANRDAGSSAKTGEL